MKIKVYQTPLAKDLPLPARAFGSDVGYDLRTIVDFTVAPGDVVQVPTGLVFDLPTKTYRVGGMPAKLALVIEPRTGNGGKGLIPVARIVDAGYRPARDDDNGLTLLLRNVGSDILELKRGDRVAQGVFQVLPTPTLRSVKREEVRWETDRKDGRWGSTGR